MEYEWRVTLSTASQAQSKEGIPPWLLRLFLLPGGWNDHSCRVIPEGLCSKSRGPFIFCLVRQTTSENGSFLPTHHHQPKTMNTKNSYTECQITNYRYRQTNTRRSVCYRKSLMEDRHFSNELVTSVQGGRGVTRINPQYVPSRRISKRRRPGMRGSGISIYCSWSHVSCQGEQYSAD